LIPATEQRIQERDLKNLGHSVPNRVNTENCGYRIPQDYQLTLLCFHRPTVSNGSLRQRPSRHPGLRSALFTS
jgi:hypothetical protein